VFTRPRQNADMSPRWTVPWLAAALALGLPSVAHAHASLARSDPRDGAVLAASPASVRFTFDDDVRLRSGIKAIRNGGASVLAGKPRIVGSRVLVVPLRAGLADGDYTVLWRVLSDDGHTLAGVMSFGVGTGRPPPEAALSVDNGPNARDVVARWLFFAGLLTAVGTAFFRLAIGPIRPRVLLGAFLLAFLGGSDAIGQASLSTRFGTVLAIAVSIAAAGAVFAALAPLYAKLEWLAVAAALALLPLPTLAGHALDAGRPRIEILVDLLHVTAASIWLGGLVSLGLALREGSAREPLVRRFSNIALPSVLVLAATGVIRAFDELDAVSQLWTTGYGRTLLVKSALLSMLVGVGWLNRYRLIPRNAIGGLRRSVAAELALFIGLAAAVGILTDLRPGRDRIAVAATPIRSTEPPPLPARQMVVVAREDGELAVALAVRPPGGEVTVMDGSGRGVDGLDVTIAGMKAGRCGPGCYGAFFRPARVVRVTVGGRPFAFEIPAKPRPATALLARATRVFRGLRSVDYLERLASSPRNRVVADFTLERPNRLEYRIKGGASGIIIAGRRWDRAPGGQWVPSPQEPTPQPEPIWAGPVTNAYILETTPSTYVVSFLKPIGPAWFTVRFDRRTLLPRQLQMTAAAHFMTHRYERFNALPRITAPNAGR
jgi:copper transport protein